ncbi:MAG TPA: DUF1345 domain-containing protein [Thermoanaerobaculia bacterium]|nr:DUF1345 domain-containing protein [Thermoanaerobaculia bacterium]
MSHAAKEATGNPEARWPVLIALVGVGGINLSLPHSLVVGPRWLLLALVVALLVPTVVLHRAGLHRLDRILGYIISILVTLALAASLVLLIVTLPSKSETPASLLESAAALWVTNILVFAIWYWRLDAGGPHRRERRGRHTAGAFFFPQMMDGAPIEHPEDWSPRFIDYVFLAFNTSTAFSPTDTAVLSRWAKGLSMLQAVISLLIVAILASRAVGLL